MGDIAIMIMYPPNFYKYFIDGYAFFAFFFPPAERILQARNGSFTQNEERGMRKEIINAASRRCRLFVSQTVTYRTIKLSRLMKVKISSDEVIYLLYACAHFVPELLDVDISAMAFQNISSL